MLKRRLCEARLTWKLSCDGPLLIADGRYENALKKKETEESGGKDKVLDKVFISRAAQDTVVQAVKRAHTAEDLRLPFYVPGTSLRGPVRAQAERILRTLLPGEPPASACDPFKLEPGSAQSCSKRLADQHAYVPYAAACPACRLFGCTGTASRIQLLDADVAPSARSVFRDMIGIDRFTGGVFHSANMRFHALEQSSFSTTVTLINFELWQLGLLAFVFRDFEEGLVSIGFGKTKGFGQVRGSIEGIELVYPMGRQEGKIQHLGTLLRPEAERAAYRLHDYEAPAFGMDRKGSRRLELFETFTVADLPGFWDAVAPAFTAFVEAGQPREDA